MPSRFQSPTAERRVPLANGLALLYGGLDWLELSTHKMLCAHLLERFAQAHAQARLEFEPQKVELSLLPPGEGEPVYPVFWISPGGIRGRFDYVLRTDEIEIVTRARPHHLDAMPNTMVRLRNEYLHRHGWEEAWRRAEGILACMFGPEAGPPQWKVSRADLFLDCQGFSFEGIDPRQWFGPRGLKMKQFWQSRITGFGANKGHGEISYWDMANDPRARKRDRLKRKAEQLHGEGVEGGSSAIVFRIYDKCQEITVKSGKWFMFHLWEQMPGWRGNGHSDDGMPIAAEPVIRVEFQLRREALKEFAAEDLPNGISTPQDLATGFARLWAYLTGHPGQKLNKYGILRTVPGWMSLRQIVRWKTGQSRERKEWTFHPWWIQVMDWHGVNAPLTRTPSAKLRAAAEMYPHTAGWVSSLAARLVTWKGGDPRAMVDTVMETIDWESDLPAKMAELQVRQLVLKGAPPGFNPPAAIRERTGVIRDCLQSGMMRVDRDTINDILAQVMLAEFAHGSAEAKTDRLTSSLFGRLAPEVEARARLRLVKDGGEGEAGPPDGGAA